MATSDTLSLPTAAPGLHAKPAKEKLPARQYFPGFDGLRGAAALGVVAYHYLRYSETASPIIAGIVYAIVISPASVDMFFILSGFLIGTILLSSRESPSYYKTFFIRRAYRILPLYYAWIGLFFLFFFLTPGYGIVAPKGYSGLAIVGIYLAMLQNNFVSVLDGTAWIGTSWTLGIEEPFYVLAPICMRVLPSRKVMAWVFGVAAVFSLLFRAVLHKFLGGGIAWGSDAAFGAYYWTPSRIGAPALGCLLAVAWATPEVKTWIQKHVRLFYWAIPVLIGGFVLVEHGPQLGIPHALGLEILMDRTMLILSALCLVVAILANPEGKLTRVMNWSLFRRFGKLSYFIYLAHWGIIWLLARFVVHKEFEHDPWLGAKLAPFAFLICWGLAELSWKYFEGPLLRRGQAYKYEPPPTVEPASARDSDVAPSGLMTAQTSQASH